MAGEDLALLHELARRAYREKRTSDCLSICHRILNDTFDDGKAFLMASRCFARTERWWLAHVCARRAVEIDPNNEHFQVGLGRTWAYYDWGFNQAEKCFLRALEIRPGFSDALINMLVLHVNKAEPGTAIAYAEKCAWNIEAEEDKDDIAFNRGLAELMLWHWQDGWKHYCASHRHRVKKEWAYGDEPRWDGSPTRCLAIYGEQGLGDEIMFASAIPDTLPLCEELVIDCDTRLVGLFKRSFPKAHVYGTRHETECPWLLKHEVTARAGGADVCKVFRKSVDAFPGRPYLVADPERCIQWRALLASFGDRPKIGIAWKGGIQITFRGRRSVTLDQLLPVLSQNAVFVNLHYEDVSDEIAEFTERTGVTIHDWQRALLTRDYDNTAALVAELDLVISVTTTVVNLAGALGKTVWCLVPTRPTWREGLEGRFLPWYGNCVEMFRQETGGDWALPIGLVADKLCGFLQRREEDTWAFAS